MSQNERVSPEKLGNGTPHGSGSAFKGLVVTSVEIASESSNAGPDTYEADSHANLSPGHHRNHSSLESLVGQAAAEPSRAQAEASSPTKRMSWAPAPPSRKSLPDEASVSAATNNDGTAYAAAPPKRRSFALLSLSRRSSAANVLSLRSSAVDAQKDEENSTPQAATKRRSFGVPGFSRRSSKAKVMDDGKGSGPTAPTKRLSFAMPGLSRRSSTANVAVPSPEEPASLGLSLDAMLTDDESGREPSPGRWSSVAGRVASLSRRASREVVEPEFKSLDQAFEEEMHETSRTASFSKPKRTSMKSKGSISAQISVGDASEARLSVDLRASASAPNAKRQSRGGFGKRTSHAHHYSSEEEGSPCSAEPSPTKRLSSKWSSQEAEAASVARLSQGGRRVSLFKKKDSVQEISSIQEEKHEELDEPSQTVEQTQHSVASGEGQRARARSRWRLVRSTIIIGLRLIHLLYDVRAVRQATSYSTKMPKNVVLKVKTEKQRKELCLTLQGDEDMYKEDVLRARLQLRHNPAVLEVLHEFWATAQRSVQQAATRAEASDLRKREYIKVMVLVGKAMLKDFFEVEARHEAERDWAEDAKDPQAKSITREAFMDAIFQLADHWTPGVSGEEYSSFLWRLLKRIAISEPGKSVLFWRQPADVRYMDPEARPDSGRGERPAPAAAGPKWTASGSRIGEFGAPPLTRKSTSLEPVRKLSAALSFMHRAARRPPPAPVPIMLASTKGATDRHLMPVPRASPDLSASFKAAGDRNLIPAQIASAARSLPPATSSSLPPLAPPAKGPWGTSSSKSVAQRRAVDVNQMDMSTTATATVGVRESTLGRTARSSSTTLTKLASSSSKSGVFAKKPKLSMSLPTGSAQFDMGAFDETIPARRARGSNNRIPG